MTSFSAALLVGGKSRRMGQDKALLPHPDGGVFWQRQLALLESLHPAEILWSGPARPGVPDHVRAVLDAAPHAGPLAGIVACLNAMRTERLLVLAVDLSAMTADLLLRLLDLSSPRCGAAAIFDSRYEPLAAVYPRAIEPLAAEHLAAGRFALQDLLREARAQGLMQVADLSASDRSLFHNVNEPGDLD